MKKEIQQQNIDLKIQKRISCLLEKLTANMHERNQIMAIALLGAITGHNTFLLGPPGTAKSLISRRLTSAFDDPTYFEYLMNRFSTPEELFGPVSIKELKEDRYIRQIDGYLPTADFAFLDEIWKSSPAILNNLLTIINEHTFKNGNEIINTPLKSLIAASNEVPPENQGLEALYDRFIIRLYVPPIEQEVNFNHLLNSKPSSEKPKIDSELLINHQEMAEWRERLHSVQLSKDTILIIKYIRQKLIKSFKELNVYVSDRRWQRAAMLLKASAFFNGRKETNHSDAILLKYCLWTTSENRESVENIVIDAVESCGFNTDINLSALDKEKEKLDKEINKELYHSEDVYDTVQLPDRKKYFKVNAVFKSNDSYGYSRRDNKEQTIYILYSYFKNETDFKPIDRTGNQINDITCNFDKQGACKIVYNSHYYADIIFNPKVLFKKGDKKIDINERLIDSLDKSVTDIRKNLSKILNQVEQKSSEYKQHLHSPFVTEEEVNIAISGITKQIQQLELRIADCERLEALCR